MIGRTLGHFRIDETIGQGGMGVVYRARDLHLDRDVAIKVLRPGLLVDDIARRRLRREALALSRLHHPGIAVVHDFDTSEGTDFLVMELVPGGTLATRLAAGPLSIPDALRIAIEVADVLESAHTSGVIHRDLKPSNIMFSWGGHAMVLDFGLARRALDAGEATVALTETQSVLGTLHYMAPEQLRGETAGPRTDVYALGVVLYEMVTGALPHDEVSAIAYAGAVLNQPPVAPGIRRADLPHGLEAVILRALEKDPAERHPSARKVAEALGAVASSGITRPHVAEPHAAPTPVPATHRPRPASVLPVMALVSIAVLLALLGTWLFRPRATPGGSIRSLAVLPLANLSGDPRQEYFADGMTDELIEDLSQIRALKVISRTSAMSYKGSHKKLPQIAHELGVEGVVEGTVVRTAGQVRVNAELVRASDEHNLWTQSFERPMGDLLALQGEVARVIAEKVRVELQPAERERLSGAASVNPAAVEACMKCLYYQHQYTSDGLRQAIEWGNQAVSRDAGYARACAALASAYTLASSVILPAAEAMPRAREAAHQALALDSAQVEARVQLAYVTAFYEWRWAEAERQLRAAITLAPGSASAHETFGYLLVANRRFAEAADELRKAHELDPLSQPITAKLLWPAYQARHFADATALGRELLTADPTNLMVRLVLGQSLYMQGDTANALPELRRLAASDALYRPFLVYALAGTGRRADALRLRDSITGAAGETFVQPYFIALMHVGLGETDAAFAELDRAVERHSEELAFLQVDPLLDPIRKDPRYPALLQRVGFRS